MMHPFTQIPPRSLWVVVLLLLGVTRATSGSALAQEPCRIEVTDRENGWPVPLVELRTNHGVRFVTDNAGVIAFDLPELMGVETWFTLSGHGYGVPADGFGMRGFRFTPRPGETFTLEVDRTIVAKRLCRLTGGGLFAEAQRFSEFAEWKESGVLGCDSIQLVEHRGKLFWGWGDTNLPHYPLGVFHMTAATTPLRPLSRFEPPLPLVHSYFRDEKGRPRGVAKMQGEGPTWLAGFVSLPDEEGEMRLVATYAKIEPPLQVYEYGLCVWNDERERFERHDVLWKRTSEHEEPPRVLIGHPVAWKDESGAPWILFGNPLPTMRCPARFEAWKDRSTWEPLEPQKTLTSGHDAEEEVKPHSGSVAWNGYRERWVTVFLEAFGESSAFGELWYAEADSPMGPWGAAVKILSHDEYTFYNPRIHPELAPSDAPFLLFEGTYTQTFSRSKQPTPRYDYNQILYRLDLDDPALAPARG